MVTEGKVGGLYPSTSLEARQQRLQASFLEQSERYAADPSEAIKDGYDDVEDWFETRCRTFASVHLPPPERPGWLREDDWDLERLVGLADQLGRKLDATDMTVGLRRFATQWLRGLPTPIDFGFLASLRFDLEVNKGRGHTLTAGQAKGVLNCAIAEVRRAQRKPKEPKERPVLEAGIYLHKDVVYKVQVAVHGSGHPYAKRLVVDRDAVRDDQDNIIEAAVVHFEYDKGAVRNLRPEEKMDLEQAKAFGAIYGVCCSCGATLTNEESIELGIGPICRRKFA